MIVLDESMLPTLQPGDRLWVDRRAYRDRTPAVGDLVVLLDPELPSRWLVKRVAVVGPGVEPAEPGRPGGVGAVPEGSVFVLSDATVPTRDSRSFGAVRIDTLVGRIYRRYAPGARRGDL